MGRASIIVFVFIATAVVLLALLSRSPIPTAHHSNGRLKQLHSTSEERPRRHDEDGSNVARLTELFRKVDVDPPDGFLSRHELIRCNLRRTHWEFLHRSRREMHLHDKNHDGFVSFSEYYPSRLQNEGNYGYDDMGWWKQDHFNASDADGDGRLNLTEFNDFRHPADSKNPKLRQWLCQEEVRILLMRGKRYRQRWKDQLPRILPWALCLARKYDEESTQHYEGSRDAPARALFAQLDKDGDGYLSDLELLPVIGKIHPYEHYYAKQLASYIISQADADKDGRLTLTEITYKFYRGMYYEHEDEYDSHDESY